MYDDPDNDPSETTPPWTDADQERFTFLDYHARFGYKGFIGRTLTDAERHEHGVLSERLRWHAKIA